MLSKQVEIGKQCNTVMSLRQSLMPPTSDQLIFENDHSVIIGGSPFDLAATRWYSKATVSSMLVVQRTRNHEFA